MTDKDRAIDNGGDDTEGATKTAWEDEEQCDKSPDPSLGGDRNQGRGMPRRATDRAGQGAALQEPSRGGAHDRGQGFTRGDLFGADYEADENFPSPPTGRREWDQWD